MRNIIRHPFSRDVLTALNRINLAVRDGELFGLLGPNGAGKSTLIRVLSTLIIPDQGEAWVNGHNIYLDAEGVRQSIGLVTGDERSFYWRLSGRDNLDFFAALYNMSLSRARSQIKALLELLDFEEKADQPFSTYSSGMKQRLSLARGLLNEPEVLLVDEPTRSLDPVSAQMIRGFIREIMVKRQERTVVLATHNLQEAQQLCDRFAVINEGKVLFEGTPSEMRKIVAEEDQYVFTVRGLSSRALQRIGAQQGVVRFYSGPDPNDSSLSILGVLIVAKENTLARIIQILVNSAVILLDCRHIEIPLEDAFARIIKK